MHRLVAEDAGGGLGEIAVAEQRNRTKIGADRAQVEEPRSAACGLTECG